MPLFPFVEILNVFWFRATAPLGAGAPVSHRGLMIWILEWWFFGLSITSIGWHAIRFCPRPFDTAKAATSTARTASSNCGFWIACNRFTYLNPFFSLVFTRACASDRTFVNLKCFEIDFNVNYFVIDNSNHKNNNNWQSRLLSCSCTNINTVFKESFKKLKLWKWKVVNVE